MKIGIWLPIWPLSEWKYEGLTRLVGFILSGINEKQDARYNVVVPYWVDNSDIDEFLSKFTAEQRRKITISKLGSRNYVLSLAMRLMLRRKEDMRVANFVRRRTDKRDRAKNKRRRNLVLALVSQARATPLGLLFLSVLGLLLAPIALLTGAILFIPVFLLLVARRITRRFTSSEGPTLLARMFDLARSVSARLDPVSIMRELTERELKTIAKNASRRSAVDMWYVPHIGYSSGVHLRGKRAFLFADFVFHDAPEGFPPHYIRQVTNDIRRVLSKADHIIAISDHVKQRHIKGVFEYPDERITVIRHGYVDISRLLPHLKGERGTEPNAVIRVKKTPESVQRSAQIIHDGLVKIFNKNKQNFGPTYKNVVFPYLRKLDFATERYAIVSTQNRPYKNTLAAIKAVERYNERAEAPLKLVMTGESSIDIPGEPIGDYIRERGLYFDAISIPRVPDNVHAALYHCADCAIAASFFEGGTGSFVFDEALSVGTPTYLSRNLSHDEGFEEFEAYSSFNFNPNVPTELATLIEKNGRDNNATLYNDQWEIAQARARKRPWSIVQSEYVEVLKQVSRGERTKSDDK